MKIIIDWSETKTTTTGKEYKRITGKDEQGNVIEASTWSDAPFYAQIAPGATIEAEIKVSADGKYKNLIGANARSGGGGSAFKSAQIEKAQERKEKSIQIAQDRAALMWAKTSACTLIANHPSYKFLDQGQIEDMIEELATKIYNMEPVTPFNS